MGEIVNLRRQRKTNGRQEDAARAASNRLRFGRTLAQKRAEKTIASKHARDLDGHRIDSGEKA